jgi:hypothetical protein
MGFVTPKLTHDMVQFFIQANLEDKPAGLNLATKSSAFIMLGYAFDGPSQILHTSSMYEMNLGFAEGTIMTGCHSRTPTNSWQHADAAP